MESFKQTIRASIRWGYLPLNLPGSALSSELAQVRSLWEKGNLECAEHVSKLLRCYFIPHNLTGAIDELLVHDDEEIEAIRVEVQALDFGDRSLPRVCASAIFELYLSAHMTHDELRHWQDEHEPLDNGISFEWALELPDEAQGVLWNHEGISLEFLDSGGGST